MALLNLMLQSNSAGGLFGGVFLLIVLALVALVIAGCWKMFEKAGHPGWAAIVPIYNAYILMLIARRPGWWLVLCFIPLVNIVIALIVAINIAENFGQGAAFGLVLNFLLGGIGYVILGFGNYSYQPPKAMRATA